MADTLSRDSPGAFEPLRVRSFSLLWGAGLVSNIGTWMNATATGWLMTDLAPSPLMVAAVQAASSLPVFLFAILAGALADLFDRRSLLLWIQTATAAVAAVFAVTVWIGAVTAPMLLALTFLMGTGAAFLAPVWQSAVPALVPRRLLPQAVALNSMSLNVARAIGPAVAGVLIAGVGIAAPFAVDTASFLLVVLAIIAWRPPPSSGSASPRETLPGAIVAGLRYASASPELKATLGRAILFFGGGSAFWALLPLGVRQSLGGGPGLYGALLGAVGAGAVIGALALPAVRGRLSPPTILGLATSGVAAATLAIGFATAPAMAAAASLLMGLSWILALTTLNLSAQLSLPDWVRGRGLSLFTTAFFGAMTLGSLAWGALGATLGLPMALSVAAAFTLAGLVAGARLRLTSAERAPDLTPSSHWPEPLVSHDIGSDRGPVMVTIRYRVSPDRLPAFLAAAKALEPARRRGGATAWGILENAAKPGEVIEWFLEESWLAHLRHHDRVTQADRILQDAVVALHEGPDPPVVSHWVGPAPHGAPPKGHPEDAGLG